MEYNTIDKNSYKIHTLKYDRFKTSDIEVVFRFKTDKERFPIVSLLCEVMGTCNKHYDSLRNLALKKEDLYNIYYNTGISRKGYVTSLTFRVNFINPEYMSEKDYLENVIKFLFDMILFPNVKNNEFEKVSFENGKNELYLDIDSTKENAMQLAFDNAFDTLDKNSISALSVTGTKEEVKAITREALYKEYLYIMQNSIVDILVMGNLDMNRAVSLIKDNYHNNRVNYINFNYYVKNIERKKPIVKMDESTFKQSSLVMLYNINDITEEERRSVYPVFNYIIGSGGLSSKLYKYLREENGLCYRVSSVLNVFDNVFEVDVSLSKENIDKAVSLIKKSVSEMVKGKFTEEDVNNAKNNITNNIELNSNSQSGINNNYVSQKFVNDYTFEEKKEHIKKVTKSDIITFAKKLKLNVIYALCEDQNGKN